MYANVFIYHATNLFSTVLLKRTFILNPLPFFIRTIWRKVKLEEIPDICAIAPLPSSAAP
jgi:hypothetical protein